MYHFIEFLVRHALTLTFVFASSLSIVALILAFRAMTQTKTAPTSQTGANNMEEFNRLLEQLLKKIEDQTKQVNSTENISGEVKDQIIGLQKQIEEKNQEIEKYKIIVQSAPTEDLKKRVEELETKLSEYEIIAEDLAELARLKEENRALQNEIKNLKSRFVSKNPTDDVIPQETSAQNAKNEDLNGENSLIREAEKLHQNLTEFPDSKLESPLVREPVLEEMMNEAENFSNPDAESQNPEKDDSLLVEFKKFMSLEREKKEVTR